MAFYIFCSTNVFQIGGFVDEYSYELDDDYEWHSGIRVCTEFGVWR